MVLFVDYGNREERAVTELFDVRGQNDFVLDLPKLAIPVALHGISVEAGQWTSEVVDAFRKMTVQQPENDDDEEVSIDECREGGRDVPICDFEESPFPNVEK